MYVEFSIQQLQNTYVQIARGKRQVLVALERLKREADTVLSASSPRVTDKPSPGPSGDIHDFYSVAKYAWPNPESADGMPWVRRDCHRNPGVFTEDFDKARLDHFIDGTKTLILAWYFTGVNRYAEGATLWLSAWFANPVTRMNPHLRYCAALPGVNDGASIGIIEGAVIPELLDYVAVLGKSPAYSSQLDLIYRNGCATTPNGSVRANSVLTYRAIQITLVPGELLSYWQLLVFLRTSTLLIS